VTMQNKRWKYMNCQKRRILMRTRIMTRIMMTMTTTTTTRTRMTTTRMMMMMNPMQSV
jgi:hypothetical protein